MVNSKRQHIRECGDTSVEAGREASQLPWYSYALNFVNQKSVLDVGCGLGKGLEILRCKAKRVLGQDIDIRLASEDIIICDLSEITSKSFDIITALEVIEHVKEPKKFVHELVRIAREGLFLTTPNWTISQCLWLFHRQEYTPQELISILEPFGKVSLFKGNVTGTEVYEVKYPQIYHVFNILRIWTLTNIPTRCWNRLIPRQCRIHSNIAAYLRIRDTDKIHNEGVKSVV